MRKETIVVEVRPQSNALVGAAFVDSIPVGTVFTGRGILWVKIGTDRRCMYLDGSGTITAPTAHWGDSPMYGVTKLTAEHRGV